MGMYKEQIRDFLARCMRKERRRRNLSQDKMSERLHVTPRAYSDLERGTECMSASSLLFFLSELSDEEAVQVIREFRVLIRETENQEKE